MPRYIDADIVSEGIEKLQTEFESNNNVLWKKNKPIYKGLCYARGIINDTPTADVVEVVRCKNCKHCEYCERYEGLICYCAKGIVGVVNEDDFCSYGEKKKEAEI